MSYYELWAILGNWKSEFTVDDFAGAFSSPDPGKVLFDMAKKGLLERIDRGKYRVNDASRYINSRYGVGDAYELLRTSRLPYSLTNVDGALVWTKGGYNANRFFGSYPIYIKVLTSDVEKWRRFLSINGKKCLTEGSRPTETLYGTYYVLVPVSRITYEEVGGLKADPLKEVVEFCRKDPYTYAPALEMLDREYNLGLEAKYEDGSVVS
jgi:hypothetical protein